MFTEYEYLTRYINRWTIELAKLDGAGPLNIYRLQVENKTVINCSCPGFQGHSRCKHLQMVQSWIDRGSPIEYFVEIPNLKEI